MGEEGLEPSRLLRPTDFKSVAYTNSATLPSSNAELVSRFDCSPKASILCSHSPLNFTNSIAWFAKLVLTSNFKIKLEARTGVAPVYEVLQTSA